MTSIKKLNQVLTTAGDMSADVNSSPFRIPNMAIVAIQCVFTGSPTGTLKLQGSNDIGLDDSTGATANLTNWTDVADSSQSVSAAGNHMWNIANPGYRWVRAVYTFSSGTGSITIRGNAKGWS